MWNTALVVVAVAAAALIHVSIAASQTLLGIGLVLFLISRGKLFFPRIWVPLSALFLWTALADVLSPDPWGGRAQIKKFFVFFLIPLLYGVVRERISLARVILIGWLVTASASGLWSLAQFVLKMQQARATGQDTYVAYIGHRITGFESHWMTFSALQLSVLSLVLAHAFFANRKLPIWIYAGCTVLFSITIVLGETRSIWVAAVPVLLYLVGMWRPKMMLVLPLAFVVAYFVAPRTAQERAISLIAPHGETDSNRHRIVTFRTGVEMVRAHPLFGLGPEQIRRQFDSFVPPDIKRPLPVGYYGHLHNDYVQIAAERGLPGLGFLLWFIGLALFDAGQVIRACRAGQSTELFLAHGMVAVTIGVLVGGFFEYNIGDSEVLMMFVSVIALSYAALFHLQASRHEPAMSQNGAAPALDVPLPLSHR